MALAMLALNIPAPDANFFTWLHRSCDLDRKATKVTGGRPFFTPPLHIVFCDPPGRRAIP